MQHQHLLQLPLQLPLPISQPLQSLHFNSQPLQACTHHHLKGVGLWSPLCPKAQNGVEECKCQCKEEKERGPCNWGWRASPGHWRSHRGRTYCPYSRPQKWSCNLPCWPSHPICSHCWGGGEGWSSISDLFPGAIHDWPDGPCMWGATITGNTSQCHGGVP